MIKRKVGAPAVFAHEYLAFSSSLPSTLRGAPSISKVARAATRVEGGRDRKAPPLKPDDLTHMAAKEVDDIIQKQKQGRMSVEALLFLADVLFEGLVIGSQVNVPADKNKAAKIWKALGDQGEAEGRYNFAMCLLHGHGVTASHHLAEAELEQLARQGDSRAQYALAVLLQVIDADNRTRHKGENQLARHHQRQQQRAYELLTCAVRGGVVPAIHNLANAFADGRPPVRRNDEIAFKLYNLASDLGDPSSSFTLGTWYCQGRGVEEDWGQGFLYHSMAAEAGLPQASYNVATHYFSGRGVEQDLQQAARYFQVAAEAGMVQAMVNLGNMHREGLGCAPSKDKAREWLRRAATMGSTAACDVLKELDSDESTDVVAKGQ